jgi:hypothetical protein
MAQRIRFAGATQRACDGENAHNRVSGGGDPQDDLEDFSRSQSAFYSARDDLHKEAGSTFPISDR